MTALRLVPPLEPRPAPTESLADLASEHSALSDYLCHLRELREIDPDDEKLADEYATAQQRADQIEAELDARSEADWQAWDFAMWRAGR